MKGGKEKEKGVGEGRGGLELETLFHKNCSLGSVKNLTTRDRDTGVGGWGGGR